jgi:hypothetical protein
MVRATSAHTFNGAPMPGLPSDTHIADGARIPPCVTYTVDVVDRDVCFTEGLSHQLESPLAMMLRRVARKKSLSWGRDVRVSDICEDEGRPALFWVLYYPHPDLVCAPLNPKTDHLPLSWSVDWFIFEMTKIWEFAMKAGGWSCDVGWISANKVLYSAFGCSVRATARYKCGGVNRQ